jgi:hypothetical protein
MEGIPKNKRYAIKRLVDNDKTLVPSDLEKLKIVELLKMIESQKMSSKEVIGEPEEADAERSLLSYCGSEY